MQYALTCLLACLMVMVNVVARSQAEQGQAEQSCLSLELELASEVHLSDTLPLTLTLTNTCEEAIQVYLAGQPAYDFVIINAKQEEVWRWSYGKARQMLLAIVVLAAGEERRFEEIWDLRDSDGRVIEPGQYQLKGMLEGEPPTVLETPLTTVEVVP